jgi:hypothetical protein
MGFPEAIWGLAAVTAQRARRMVGRLCLAAQDNGVRGRAGKQIPTT